MAAVGSVGPIINMLIGFFLGLASGAGVVISQYYGAKNDGGVSETVHTSLMMTLVMAVLFTGVFTVMIAFTAVFGWFPLDDIKAWAMFIICSCVCIAISTIVSSHTKIREDRSLEEALRRAKEEKT